MWPPPLAEPYRRYTSTQQILKREYRIPTPATQKYIYLSLSYIFIQTRELIKVVYPSRTTALKRYRLLRSCMCSVRISGGKTIHFCVLVVLPSWSRAELDSLHVFCASNVKSIVNSDDFCVHSIAERAFIYLHPSEKWAGRWLSVVAREYCIF